MVENDERVPNRNDNVATPTLWMVNQYAITPDLPGGTRHYDFACELVKQGWNVIIFASDINLALRKHTKLEKGQLWSEEIVNGVRFVWVSAAPYTHNNWRRVWNMLSFVVNFIRVSSQINLTPQVIIGSSPHLFTPVGAWWVARRKHAKFVLELRDLWPQAIIDMTGTSDRKLSVKIMRRIEKFNYKVASKIITLAKGSETYLLQYSVPHDKITYIPNGVHLGNFKMPEEDAVKNSSMWRQKWGFAGFTIIYTGAHGPANALNVILSAAQILLEKGSCVQFALVGDGPTKNMLVAEAKQRKLSNVRFMDPVPKSDIPYLLAAADAAVITLRSVDAFSYAISPNKLFDYMAAAKPIICSVSGDVADLVNQSGVGYSVPPEDPQALADAVIKLAAMPIEELMAMGIRGRNVVEHDFSRVNLANRLVNVIQSANDQKNNSCS